jgi:hypothetical protein
MAIPSLEQTMREVTANPYLTAILQLAQSHMRHGCGGVDCIDEMVAGDVFEEEEHNSPQTDLMAHIESLTLEQKRAVIPYLRRLGYSVTMFRDDHADDCPMSIHFPGKAPTPKFQLTAYRVPHTLYYATSPGMLRLRGVLRCLPRLLAWKWRAVFKANAPDQPGGKRWRAEYALYVRRGVPVPNPKRRRIECGLYQERQWPITMWLG